MLADSLHSSDHSLISEGGLLIQIEGDGLVCMKSRFLTLFFPFVCTGVKGGLSLVPALCCAQKMES